MKIIGITGGIGSGKSVVSRILNTRGIPVYDCDKNAKRLEEEDLNVVDSIKAAFGEDSYMAGKLNKQYLAKKIFGDKKNLETMNNIVHPAVRKDFAQWCDKNKANGVKIVGIESAILSESSIDKIVDSVWVVTAPLETRIERACKRDKAKREDIENRIINQKESAGDVIILNDDEHSLIMQIEVALKN